MMKGAKLKKLDAKVVSQIPNMVPFRTAQDEVLDGAKSLFDDDLDISALDKIDKIYEQSKNVDKSGFYEDDSMPRINREAAKIWYYPSNMAIRQYQQTIVQSALYKNTLVCLPTGLGKTLIASVLMYNYFRWFPTGKIVFVAPTTTLVAQQIIACYNIMGIPEHETVALTGKVDPNKRAAIWAKKRVFFCTPHVVASDLADGKCPGKDIVLVVIDEAHKATKNYHFCTMIRYLSQMSNHYRVLALSATPGSNLGAVQDVITNLQIAFVEVRDENDADVRKYLQDKSIHVNKVKLTDEVSELQDLIFQLLQIPLNKLVAQKAFFNANPRTVTKGALYFAKQNINGKFHLSGDLTAANDLCTLNEKLSTQGLKDFSDAIEKYYNDAWTGKTKSNTRANIIKQPLFKTLLEKTRELVRKGHVHPKLIELERVVLNHFEENRRQGTIRETRVIIFASLRATVENIVARLSKFTGTLKVMKFVGQSGKTTKGLANKDQKRVISEFVRGNYNTLVSTSVGEEGLDIGEVDLIVCYDAVASPTRMVQRMGRTGRKRKGEAVIIVTEGTEATKYHKSQKKIVELFQTMKSITKSNSGCIFYGGNNRMIPNDIHPILQLIQVRVNPLESNFSSPHKHRTKTDNALISISEEDYLNKHYGVKIPDQIDSEGYWRPIVERIHKDSKWRDFQNSVSPIYQVKHSAASMIISRLFRNIDNESYDDDLGINFEPTVPFVDEEELNEAEKAPQIEQNLNDMTDDTLGGPDIHYFDNNDWNAFDDFDQEIPPSSPTIAFNEDEPPIQVDIESQGGTDLPSSPAPPQDTSNLETSFINRGFKRKRREQLGENKRARIVDKWFYSLPAPIMTNITRVMTPTQLKESVETMHKKIDRLDSSNVEKSFNEIPPVTLTQNTSPKAKSTFIYPDEVMQTCPKCGKAAFCLDAHASVCSTVDENDLLTQRQIPISQSSESPKLRRLRKNRTMRSINRRVLAYPSIYVDYEAEEEGYVQEYVLMDSDQEDDEMSSGSSFIDDSVI
jgi:ERCC4-related helicase